MFLFLFGIFTCLLKGKLENKYELHYFLLYNQKIMLWPWNNTRRGRALQLRKACEQFKRGSQASDAPGDQQQAVLIQYLLGIFHIHTGGTKAARRGNWGQRCKASPGPIHTPWSLIPQQNSPINWELVSPRTPKLLLELHSFSVCAGICRYIVKYLKEQNKIGCHRTRGN